LEEHEHTGGLLLLGVGRRVRHLDDLLEQRHVHGLGEVREPRRGVRDACHGVKKCSLLLLSARCSLSPSLGTLCEGDFAQQRAFASRDLQAEGTPRAKAPSSEPSELQEPFLLKSA
jgi:hypothetical protein